MTKIKNYQLFSAKARLNKPIADSTHTLTEISFIVLRIQTEKDVVGESYLLSFQYSSQAIVGALKDVGQLVLGEEVFNTVRVFETINHTDFQGFQLLKNQAGDFRLKMNV